MVCDAMNAQITLGVTEPAEYAAFEALYQISFPDDERKPFALMCRRAEEGKAELLSLRRDGQFVGLLFTLPHGDYVLLDYLAVDPACRNGGLGAEALRLVRARYPDKLLFLEVEEPDTEMARRRMAFYGRNGLLPTGLHIELFTVDMQILSDGGRKIPFACYLDHLCTTMGEYSREHVFYRSQE